MLALGRWCAVANGNPRNEEARVKVEKKMENPQEA
jgi:hypothetical protein